EEEEEEGQESEGEGEGGEEGSSSEGGRKKLLLIIGLVLLLVVGGAAAAYFTGLMEPLLKMFSGGGETTATSEAGKASSSGPGNSLFHDLPEILVNLNTGGRKASFLKIKVALELANANDLPQVEKLMPRVLDNFQVYLRELRVEDLQGSAGMYRLREELLARVNAAVAPAKVNDVLFKEMLVQ
ncbi:MAG: flagellar basal body-associated FliL family protein, partial [Rhodospirillales bacterium]